MSWNPQATVTINGVDYTDKAFIGAAITYGRTETTQQPRPGYAAVSLYEITNTDYGINIGDPITITAKKTTGVNATLFTGTISDISATVISSNPEGTYLRYDLVGVGPLARLNRRLTGAAGYPSQDDGDRMMAILEAIYSSTWAQQPASQSWATTNATLTWNTYDPYIGTIDQPGQYQLASYSGGETLGYNLTNAAATSGLGVVYDTPGNRINYDDATHRQINASTNGFWTIPIEAILSSGLTQAQRLGDVATSIKVAYNGGDVTVTNATAAALYGDVARSFQTVLANLTDATDQATRYLGLYDAPAPQFDTLTLAVHQPNLDNATINTALDVYQGRPLAVNNLPNGIGPSFTGFIEGWTWRIGQYTADLKLTVSDYGRSVVTTKWQGATPTLTWATTTPTTKWNEAIVI